MHTRYRTFNTLVRIGQYIASRFVTLFIMVVISVFLTTLIANMGGYVDEVIRADTALAIGMALRGDEYAQSLPREERMEYTEAILEAVLEARGLNQPFMVRTVRWVGDALTLNWGSARMGRAQFAGNSTYKAYAHILERLPRTLLLFGTANVLLFFVSIIAALALTHARGSWIDRLIILLSPLSSAPPWVYGILLTVLALQIPGTSGLRFFTAAFDSWPTEFKWAYVPLILRHMLLPILSIFLSKLFQSIFAWRTFFLLHYDEDYVELAKAKGLPRRMLERRYILRPSLPSVLTNFALLLTSLWQEVIVLEHFFNVEGIGKLFVSALGRYDTPMILAIVVFFAYLLALTVFLLDIAYALVDPRVRVGRGTHLNAPAFRRKLRWPKLSKLSLKPPDLRALISSIGDTLYHFGYTLKHLWSEVVRYPSALVGMAIIALMIGVAIYAMIAMPYQEAVMLWRGDQSDWYRYPKNAAPAWLNTFTRDNLPSTLVFDSRTDPIERHVSVVSDEMTDVTLSFPFDYTYDRFPQEISVYLHTAPVERAPLISMSWHTPDGRSIRLGEVIASGDAAYRLAHDDRLIRRLDGAEPAEALLADPQASELTPLKGRYELRVSALMFEEPMELDAEFILYGQVHGLAGTDARRRDLMIAVLWGTVVALAFGLLAAVGTTFCMVFLAAMGAWFGGWLDELLQRITEVNLVLPFLPVCVMIFTLYSKSFWVLLGVFVLLSIFGSDWKNYRALFMQTKQESFIEAARAYGAGDWRIIFVYMIPRVAAVMVPNLVILVPSYVFLESALAFLGLSDPTLPTWGKLVHSAFENNVYVGPYHLVLMPAIILMVTGLAFSLLGYALEHALNPQANRV